MEKQFAQIVKKYHLQVKMNPLIKTALTHSSYANEHKLESNERLEFLGDAILGLCVAEYLYQNFKNLQEGDMSKTRAIYVCEDANMEYAIALGLDKMLLLGNGEELSGGRSRARNLNCCFEAFLAAIYLSSGLDDVLKILEIEVFPHIHYEDIVPFVDYKSRLQEYLQAETRETVQYKEVSEIGPAHNKTYTFKVLLDGVVLGEGSGKKKKDAQQEAAKRALEKMARK